MGLAVDIKATLELPEVAQMVQSKGLNPGGRVQRYITTTLIGIFDGYVPLRSGVLKGSAVRNNAPPFEQIIYDGPYANRLYHNPQYNFNEAPQRGAYWDRRAWIDNKDTFLANLQLAIDTGRIQ